MKNTILALILCLSLSACTGRVPEPIRVLLLSGKNNHSWQRTTPRILDMFGQSGRFRTDITERPDTLNPEQLAGYDVVVSNWTAFPEVGNQWDDRAKEALLDFVKGGGGFVAIHAASCIHYDHPEYLQLTGGRWGEKTYHAPLGDWGEQTEHSIVGLIEVIIGEPSHPVTRGMANFTARDELWIDTELHPDAEVIAYSKAEAYADRPEKVEPVLIVTRMGKGRGFYHVLGHETDGMENPSFRTLLLRGTEWAATGDVTDEE